MAKRPQPMRAVSHPALATIDGQTLAVVARCTGNETIVTLADPNTGETVASFRFFDNTNYQVETYIGVRCTAREQNQSYKRKGD